MDYRWGEPDGHVPANPPTSPSKPIRGTRYLTKHGHTTEGNTRSAFADLLKRCSSLYGWHLVEKYQFKDTNKKPLRADGALVDELTLVHGLWEAKDADDDLTKEITRKRDAGYPLTNILFQSPGHAVLYQDNRIVFNEAISTPEKLVEVLELFFEHKQSQKVDWEEAVTKFAEKIPDLAKGITGILEGEFKQNATFRENFQSFTEVCRRSINLTSPTTPSAKCSSSTSSPSASSARFSTIRSSCSATSSPPRSKK